MRSYNVSAAEVSAALRIQNMEFPSGRIDEGQKETAIRTIGKIAKWKFTPGAISEQLMADYTAEVQPKGNAAAA